MAPKGSRPSFIGFGCRGAKAPENVSVGPPQPLPTVQRGQRLPLARVGHSQSSRPGLHSTNSRVASLASTGPDQDERASGSGQHGQHYSEENTVKHVTGAKRNADTVGKRITEGAEYRPSMMTRNLTSRNEIELSIMTTIDPTEVHHLLRGSTARQQISMKKPKRTTTVQWQSKTLSERSRPKKPK